MAVKKNQIQTKAQAYDYAIGSANAARRGVCPSAVGAYAVLAEQVKAGIYGLEGQPLDTMMFLASLAAADAECTAAPDYKPTIAAPQGSKSPAPKIDTHTGGAAPEITPEDEDETPFDLDKVGVKAAGIAGVPWWLWLAGGAAAYFLLKGKKKTRRKKTRRKKSASRRRRR